MNVTQICIIYKWILFRPNIKLRKYHYKSLCLKYFPNKEFFQETFRKVTRYSARSVFLSLIKFFKLWQIYSSLNQTLTIGLPGGPVVNTHLSPRQGLIPDLGVISTRLGATKSECLRAHALGNRRSYHDEEACALQLEKVHTHPQRPSAAKTKYS